jgi:hypothetical protein
MDRKDLCMNYIFRRKMLINPIVQDIFCIFINITLPEGDVEGIFPDLSCL